MLVCTTCNFTPGTIVDDSLTSYCMSADFTPFNEVLLRNDSMEALNFVHDPDGEHKIKLGYCSSDTTTYKDLANEAAVDGFHFAADLSKLNMPNGAVGYFYVPVRLWAFGDEGPSEVYGYIQIPSNPANVTVGQLFELMDTVPEDVCAISPGPEPSGDFTTATVTITNTSESNPGGAELPILEVDCLNTFAPVYIETGATVTVEIPLYKGKTVFSGSAFSNLDNVNTTGNITFDEDNWVYVLTGDAAVTGEGIPQS